MSNLTDLLNDGWSVLPGWNGTSSSVTSNGINFVQISKIAGNPFFDEVAKGCVATALSLDVTCHVYAPVNLDAQEQNDLVYDIVNNPGKYNMTKVDGLAISTNDPVINIEAINYAMSLGIPVVTFDSDSPDSKRLAFISTNSTAFGEELGKVLNQLSPEGGGYAMITSPSLNLQLREEGVRMALKGTKWVERYPPFNCQENGTLALEKMYQWGADLTVDGIVPVGGWPMFNPDPMPYINYARIYNYNTTSVVADTIPVQMDIMNAGFVDGLVGQLPYAIGSLFVQVLLNITEGKKLEEDVYGTHVLEVLRVPLVLPPVQMNYNYLGGLVALGYTLFAIVALIAIIFLYWIYANQDTRTVRASQPVFMAMLCGGSLLMASAMIPLGIEDKNYTQRGTDIACMSIPWLLVIGFCTIFAALLTKTWRIVRILENAARFQRVKISVTDVLYPYFALLAANVIILICWTVINPLVYDRTATPSRDGWNRVISTYGHCVSSNPDSKGAAAPYLGCLAIINGGLLILANLMAYRARNIRTEFGESHYIAIVMASMMQAFLIGIPIIFLVLNQPSAYYTVIVFLDFAVCLATLLFMFVPKILAHREILAKKRAKARNGDEPSMVSSTEDNGEGGLKFRKRDSGDEPVRVQRRTSLNERKNNSDLEVNVGSTTLRSTRSTLSNSA